MTPTGMSPISNIDVKELKPAKVISYLSDDSASGELPKRAYSVGSRPKQVHRPILQQEIASAVVQNDNRYVQFYS